MNPDIKILFEPYKLGRLELKNRFVRSATYVGLSDEEGFVSPAGVELVRRLAENEIGLIITGFTYVSKHGQAVANMNGMQDDEHIPPYRKMTKVVHDNGGKIIMQLFHGGANAYFAAKQGRTCMAVSPKSSPSYHGVEPKEMTEADIAGLVKSFGLAAARARKAGFDGVQIHGAHGYLVSQFLSPLTNHRQDRWGGSLENRQRFLIEVVRAAKEMAGDDFLVTVKLGCRDFMEDGRGMTLEDGVRVAVALQTARVDLIEVSHNMRDEPTRLRLMVNVASPEREAYFMPEARRLREAVSLPLCLVGGLRSLPVILKVVNSGTVDLVALSRPLIREPDLIRRWKGGDLKPAACISCGRCFHSDGRSGFSIFCAHASLGESCIPTA